MPWRRTKDPYFVWLSEVILQQTQVSQGLPYYLRFKARFPDVFSLASASEEEVLKLWQGLGYYSRGRNLHAAAKAIAGQYDGKFPDSYKGLLQLKGIGEYTAAAIASICYNEPVAVVDGNVVRVISRLFMVKESFHTASGRKLIHQLAGQLLDKHHPGDHNQAMMELGSLVCRPSNPLCTSCPVAVHCQSFEKKCVSEYPVKRIKTPPKARNFTFLVPVFQGKTLLVRREGSDIWKNLYTFPYKENNQPGEAVLHELLSDLGLTAQGIPGPPVMLKHVLSHQVLHASFFTVPCRLPDKIKKSNIFEVKIPDIHKTYPLPRLMTRFLETEHARDFLVEHVGE